MPLLTTRLYLFCVPLTKHVTEPHLPFFFFFGSYTYFNAYHIYPLFCFWVDQIREPLSHIFFIYLFIYLWEASSILILLSII